MESKRFFCGSHERCVNRMNFFGGVRVITSKDGGRKSHVSTDVEFNIQQKYY